MGFLFVSAQRETSQHFVIRTRRLQEALVINQFLHIRVKIGLLFDAVINLLKELLVNQRLDATNRKMGNKVLPIAQVAKVVKGVEDIRFKVIKSLWSFVHAEPKHSRRTIAPEKSRAVEIHREGLVLRCHLPTSLADSGNIKVFRLTDEFQGQVDVVRPAVVDVLLVRQVLLQVFHQSGILRPAGDLYG